MEAVQAYLGDILHVVSQWLLVPDIILLLAFIAYALFSIGSIIAEYFTERKHFDVVMPAFLDALIEAREDGIPAVVEESGLLRRQKDALLTVYEHRHLPGDALVALIKREVEQEESRYDRITGRNNTATRVAPMLGLMGTLIPLGPGIEALGRADTSALSSSLLVAFDTTVAGLAVAAVCLIVGKIRNNWYENYLSALDAAMATMLEKIEGSRSQAQPVAVIEGVRETPAHEGKPDASRGLGPMPELEPMPEFNPKSQPVFDQAADYRAVQIPGIDDAPGPVTPVAPASSVPASEAIPVFGETPEPAFAPGPMSESEPAKEPAPESSFAPSLFFEPVKNPLDKDFGARE